jgi:hypothetical protein
MEKKDINLEEKELKRAENKSRALEKMRLVAK